MRWRCARPTRSGWASQRSATWRAIRNCRLGLSNEFIGRADGWQGLAARYGLRQAPTGLDHGLAYDAIAGGQVDVIDIYTTDAKIGHLGLNVLQDDKAYFPRYDAVVLYRLDVPQRFPAAWAALQQLDGRIDEEAMIAMNARAELQGVAFDAIARDFLAGDARRLPAPAPAASGPSCSAPDLGRLAWQHLGLVAASVAAAALVAIPLAVASFARPRCARLAAGRHRAAADRAFARIAGDADLVAGRDRRGAGAAGAHALCPAAHHAQHRAPAWPKCRRVCAMPAPRWA